jgi:hypothetical protein
VKDSRYSNGRPGRTGFYSGSHTQSGQQNGEEIMVKPKPKQEKRVETTEEFVKRINQHKEWDKHNGKKRGAGRHHR